MKSYQMKTRSRRPRRLRLVVLGFLAFWGAVHLVVELAVFGLAWTGVGTLHIGKTANVKEVGNSTYQAQVAKSNWLNPRSAPPKITCRLSFIEFKGFHYLRIDGTMQDGSSAGTIALADNLVSDVTLTQLWDWGDPGKDAHLLTHRVALPQACLAEAIARGDLPDTSTLELQMPPDNRTK